MKYKAVVRALEHLLADLGAGTALTEEQIGGIERRLDELEDTAPVVMQRIFATIESRYSRVAYVQEAIDLYR